MTKIARTTCKPGSPLDPALGAIAFALFTAAMAFMLFATRVSAQQVGDAREGLSYAQANCANAMQSPKVRILLPTPTRPGSRTSPRPAASPKWRWLSSCEHLTQRCPILSFPTTIWTTSSLTS